MPQEIKGTAMRSFQGYAITDREKGTRMLRVYVPELQPFLQGDLKALEISNDVTTNSDRSGAHQTSIKATNYIECEYRDEDTNRAFPPGVRAGEEVIVYTYSDHNNFYWKSAARNDGNRRTETMRWSISGTLDNVATLTDDNTMFIEMDTRDTHRFRISTSKADEELHRYLFMIDADKSMVTLSDDIGNIIYIDSETPRVCMKNSDNSLIDLNGKNIAIMCEQDITIISEKGNINIDARTGIMCQHSKDDMTMKTDAEMFQYSKDSMHITSDNNRDITVKNDQQVNVGKNETTTIGADQSLTVTGKKTVSVTGTYSSSSQGDMSFSTQGNLSTSSMGNTSLTAMGTMSLSSTGSLSLATSAGLSMSFTGSGTMTGNGGSLTMSLSSLNINNG